MSNQSANSQAQKKPEKMKKIKARIINEDQELVMGLIDVPESDPRPAFDPRKDSLKEVGGVGEGNPQKFGPTPE